MFLALSFAAGIFAIAFIVGYRPSRYWKLKKFNGSLTCPACGSTNVYSKFLSSLGLTDDTFHHCNKCDCEWVTCCD